MIMENLIDSYTSGDIRFDLCFRNNTGGEFWLNPENESGLPLIVIGLEEEDFWQVHATLLHELFEMHMHLAGCRFLKTNDFSRSHGAFDFAMSHSVFSNICVKVMEGMKECERDLKKEWTKFNNLHEVSPIEKENHVNMASNEG